jgi:hypothetical protein
MSPEEVEPPNFHLGAAQPKGLRAKAWPSNLCWTSARAITRCFWWIRAKMREPIPPVRGTSNDDVWMLSNGNVLVTRMQYIAEITPEKKVCSGASMRPRE